MLETTKPISKLKYYKLPLLMTFSFLVGCMITINTIPLDRTCRIDDTDREYNIMQNAKLHNPELIILVMSAPKYLARRNVIRRTWLKLRNDPRADEAVSKFKMKHYFVLGSLGLSADEILHLSTEQSEFSDILILPMYDSYDNLTEKLVKSFVWLNEQYDYGLGYKYVLKCDDDSFVRLDRLGEQILSVEATFLNAGSKQQIVKTSDSFYTMNTQINDYNDNKKLEVYWGYFNGDAKIKRVGKWREPNWIACDRYLPYALGGGYILSKGLVTYIANNANSLRRFQSEDVSVGLWLSSVNNVLRIHDIRFATEWKSRGCRNVDLVSHPVNEKNMQKFYTNILRMDGKMCEVERIERKYYWYRWDFSPSQCCALLHKKSNK